jgi:hypothetical protein
MITGLSKMYEWLPLISLQTTLNLIMTWYRPIKDWTHFRLLLQLKLNQTWDWLARLHAVWRCFVAEVSAVDMFTLLRFIYA